MENLKTCRTCKETKESHELEDGTCDACFDRQLIDEVRSAVHVGRWLYGRTWYGDHFYRSRIVRLDTENDRALVRNVVANDEQPTIREERWVDYLDLYSCLETPHAPGFVFVAEQDYIDSWGFDSVYESYTAAVLRLARCRDCTYRILRVRLQG